VLQRAQHHSSVIRGSTLDSDLERGGLGQGDREGRSFLQKNKKQAGYAALCSFSDPCNGATISAHVGEERRNSCPNVYAVMARCELRPIEDRVYNKDESQEEEESGKCVGFRSECRKVSSQAKCNLFTGCNWECTYDDACSGAKISAIWVRC